MNLLRRHILLNNDNQPTDKGFFIFVSRNTYSSPNTCWSFDNGKTWTYKTFNCNNTSLRVSQDLNCFLSAGFRGESNFSLDHGVTWASTPIHLDYAAISNDGNVITGCQAYSRKTFRIPFPFTSYTQLYTATQDIWTQPSINYNGTLITGRTDSNKSAWIYDSGSTRKFFTGSTSMGQPDIASTSNIIYWKAGSILYKSEDRGNTYSIVHQNLDTQLSFDTAERTSNTGEFFILTAQENGKVCIFYDYGNTYRLISGLSGRVIASCSSSGKYMAYTAGLNIFVSSDYGQTFQQIPYPSGLTTSGDGTTITIEDIP